MLDGWLVHTGDRADLDGVRVLARDLLMSSDELTAAMVADALELVR